MKFVLASKRMRTSFLLIAFMLLMSPIIHAGVWDMDIPVPGNDPAWATFKTLWDKHYNGRNIDQIIACLKGIEQKNPESLEVNLWLSKVYAVKGKHTNKSADYKLSETYAIKAHEIDKDNILALKLLVDAAPNICSYKEIMAKYGSWIRSAAPLPTGEALPPMTDQPGWDRFYGLWKERCDIDKAMSAVKMLDEMASANPNDGMAQIWACRGNYYIGEYWSSFDRHKTNAMPYYNKGIKYGTRAKKLLPYSVPATYWYQLNLARHLQYASIITQTKYLKTFVGLLMFCSYENSLYYYFGPNLTLGTMITNSGWLAEKGMGIAGVSLAKEMTSLELAEILYPDYLYVPYAKADILAYKGKKNEAMKILEKILAMDPDKDKYAMPENRCHQRFSRMLYNNLKKGK